MSFEMNLTTSDDYELARSLQVSVSRKPRDHAIGPFHKKRLPHEARALIGPRTESALGVVSCLADSGQRETCRLYLSCGAW
ncbi:hypothetical protein KOW79_021460 [Hemibagrus wyckioides]|uniref:Uncharacterized protein n=1 Tax=Hemibagrus wyckioides TaxID=337641 RepID=A0A9D3N3Z9_9TELE|nr:hypothetical protein KOW79_021460 [Hemibagrus wyckioides]